MYKYKVTVFTPTYNRAHTLERLYKSLQKQTFKDFEWLVIDDGSLDHTSLLIDKWQKESNTFPIRYYTKKNGGKHTAINYGLDLAQGELFFTADSDDYLTADALKKVETWACTLPQNEMFCGVVGNWGYTYTETPNTIFEALFRDVTLLERYSEVSDKPIDGERAYVFFTEIHRNYKYPVFSNEKFITEAVAWNRMAKDGYKMRVYNDIIYIYKFLEGGLTLTGNKLFLENPKGYGLWLKEKAEFSDYTLWAKLKMVYSYFLSLKDKLSYKEIAENIGVNIGLIYILCFFYKGKRLLN